MRTEDIQAGEVYSLQFRYEDTPRLGRVLETGVSFRYTTPAPARMGHVKDVRHENGVRVVLLRETPEGLVEGSEETILPRSVIERWQPPAALRAEGTARLRNRAADALNENAPPSHRRIR